MPETDIVFYQDENGNVPVLDWMKQLAKKDTRAYKKCVWLIGQLEDRGCELARPHSGYLRDGVHELRARIGKVNYRVLYGFVADEIALLACGLTKEKRVPPNEIDRAVARIEEYKQDPQRFGHVEEK